MLQTCQMAAYLLRSSSPVSNVCFSIKIVHYSLLWERNFRSTSSRQRGTPPTLTGIHHIWPVKHSPCSLQTSSGSQTCLRPLSTIKLKTPEKKHLSERFKQWSEPLYFHLFDDPLLCLNRAVININEFIANPSVRLHCWFEMLPFLAIWFQTAFRNESIRQPSRERKRTSKTQLLAG